MSGYFDMETAPYFKERKLARLNIEELEGTDLTTTLTRGRLNVDLVLRR